MDGVAQRRARHHTQCEQADAAHAAGEDTFTYGVLYQQEAEVAEFARLQLDASLQALTRAVRKGK